MPEHKKIDHERKISDDRDFFQLSWQLTLRYIFIYLIMGSIWIWLSDLLLYLIFRDRQLLNNISMAKGWFFMLSSSLSFFLMLRKRQKLWSSALDRLEMQQKNILEQERLIEESQKRVYEADRMREHQMYYDPLTHLPNRNYLEREYNKRSRNQSIAIVYIDIDDFRHINDSNGYEVGNKILRRIAEILSKNLRDSDVAARLGADEFAIMVEPVESRDSLNACIIRIQTELRGIWDIGGKNVYLSSSAGAALFPEHGDSFDQLLHNAELAMVNSKVNGKNTFSLFMDDIRQKAVHHADMLTQLRRAIDNNEFLVYYQPQINLVDGSVRGVEALVRWQHPERGILSPGEFISLAEESGLIIQIGDLVLEEVAKQKEIWIKQEICPQTISINISGKRLRGKDLAIALSRVLKPSGVDKNGRIEIELTETVMLENPEAAISNIIDLRKTGVSFALDDFGSGYASLNYLSRLPVDILKIDMEFIQNLKASDHNAIIVANMINLAHGLGMQVIAEGIEELYQLNFLQDMNCDIGQGYYFSKPVPASDLQPLLKRGYFDLSLTK